jgi:hypothetical protein
MSKSVGTDHDIDDDGQRTVITEEPADGRGKTGNEPQRALTRVEKMYRARPLPLINLDEFSAAGALRNLHFLLVPPSEGVSSYLQSTGGADPARKADRKARRLTGVELLQDGETIIGARRHNDDARWRYRNALVAMAGVRTDDDELIVDWEIVDLMIDAVTETEAPPTQIQIGRERTAYSGNKQLTAAGATFIRENLHRLALHFRFAKVAQRRR